MGHGRRPIHFYELRLHGTGDAPGGSAPRRPLTHDADAGLPARGPGGRHRDDAVAGRGRPRPGRRDRAPPGPRPSSLLGGAGAAGGGPSPTRPRAPPAGGRPDGMPGPVGPFPTPVDAVPLAVEGARPGGDPGTRWHPAPPLRPFPRGPPSPFPGGGPRPTGAPGRDGGPPGGPLGLSAFAPGARSAWRAAPGAGGARGRRRGRPARCRPWPVRCPNAPGDAPPPPWREGPQGAFGEGGAEPSSPPPPRAVAARAFREGRPRSRTEGGRPSGARSPANPAAARPPSGRVAAGRSVPDVSPSLCRAEASLGPGLPRPLPPHRGPRRLRAKDGKTGPVRTPPPADAGGRRGLARSSRP